jgi:hypothetical protein
MSTDTFYEELDAHLHNSGATGIELEFLAIKKEIQTMHAELEVLRTRSSWIACDVLSAKISAIEAAADHGVHVSY